MLNASGIRKKKISLTVATFISLALAIPSTFAATKTIATCSKVNQTKGAGSSLQTCKKVGSKLQWVNTPATSSTIGTPNNPVPMGIASTVGDFTYRVDGIEFGLDEAICKANSFNDGCTYDDNFTAIVDPKANFNWAGVTLTASNKSKAIAKPAGSFSKTFSLVLPNGQLLDSEIFAIGDNNFSNVEVVPGGSGNGMIFFKIPKSITSLKSLLVIRDSSFFTKSKDLYFQLNW
jgi:hypothetical protein